jgi:predicted dehydrogenase
MSELKLGVMGMSPGNGHPYSWSAIFNGYDPKHMASCPFPVIPEYLGEQNFPEVAIPGARVTHIWTQSTEISSHIARASRIDHIVADYTDMIGAVDGILLARDDAENHLEMSAPFLRAGLPIFIDKPVVLTLADLDTLYSRASYDGQIFSCSALRYAKEFILSPQDSQMLGPIHYVHATVPKKWDTYAVHIIEPVLTMLRFPGSPETVKVLKRNNRTIVTASFPNDIIATFSVLNDTACPLSITLYGEGGTKTYEFRDSFNAFKTSLEMFITGMKNRKPIIPVSEIRNVVEVIERGRAE